MREVEFQVSLSALSDRGLGDIVTHASSAGLERLRELVTHGPGVILQVVVDEPLSPTTLDDISELVWWERLMTDGEAAVYLLYVQPRDRETAGSLLAAVDGPGNHDEPSFEVSVIAPTTCLQEGVALDTGTERRASGRYLDHLTSSPHDHRPLSRLTDRQQEILRLAYDMGYYEVPRTASSADIGTRISLDPSTVAEHLQRAERNLLRSILE